MRIACICTCIMGLTWVFGAFALADAAIVFQWLFTIFNSLQGLFIFIFHTFRNTEIQKNLRNWWYTALYKIDPGHQKPLSSDNSSSSANLFPMKTLKKKWGQKKLKSDSRGMSFGLIDIRIVMLYFRFWWWMCTVHSKITMTSCYIFGITPHTPLIKLRPQYCWLFMLLPRLPNPCCLFCFVIGWRICLNFDLINCQINVKIMFGKYW